MPTIQSALVAAGVPLAGRSGASMGATFTTGSWTCGLTVARTREVQESTKGLKQAFPRFSVHLLYLAYQYCGYSRVTFRVI